MGTIVFDMYGTLVFKSSKINAFRFLFGKLQPESKRSLLSHIMTQPFHNELKELESIPNEILIEFQSMLEAEIQSIELFDDTINVLEELQRSNNLYLLSNLASPFKYPFFHHGLDQFMTPLFSCDLGVQKPDPEVFKILVEQTNVPAENIIMIGDSKKSDYEGSQKAGMKSILIDRLNKYPNEYRKVSSLSELLSLELH